MFKQKTTDTSFEEIFKTQKHCEHNIFENHDKRNNCDNNSFIWAHYVKTETNNRNRVSFGKPFLKQKRGEQRYFERSFQNIKKCIVCVVHLELHVKTENGITKRLYWKCRLTQKIVKHTFDKVIFKQDAREQFLLNNRLNTEARDIYLDKTTFNKYKTLKQSWDSCFCNMGPNNVFVWRRMQSPVALRMDTRWRFCRKAQTRGGMVLFCSVRRERVSWHQSANHITLILPKSHLNNLSSL